MLELSERLGMTAAELGARMSAKELMERRVLDEVKAAERQRAQEKADRERKR